MMIDQLSLPNLRDDLEFFQLSRSERSGANWQIHDPLQHRFFQISDDTRRVLSIWKGGTTIEGMLKRTRDLLGYDLDPVKLSHLIQFLEKSNLVQRSEAGSWKQLAEKREHETQSFSKKLLNSYLFIRVPMMKPEPLLKRLAPLMELLYRPVCFWIFAVIGLIGLYLSFSDMLQRVQSPFDLITGDGLLQIGFALAILKTVHELAHAITAYRYGCRVPTIGMALMVFVPLLYTDVSDAWRLSSKRERLLISGAGMIAELFVAAVATFAWAFVADGLVRESLFYIATVGWISSLAFNLNPLMKFDGYYILADLLELENLQSRAFALARWKLRQWLILPSLIAPEIFPRKRAAFLICYAVMTWTYRLFVFTAISVFLFNFVTKFLGIILLIATLGQLIILPIWREARTWRQLLSAEGGKLQFYRPIIIAVIAVMVLFLPFSGSVHVPAVLTEGDIQRIYPPRAALIAEINVSNDSPVEAGVPIIRFESPDLTARLEKLEVELNAFQLQLTRAISHRRERQDIALLQQKVGSLKELKFELEAEIDRLEVVSNFSGRVVQLGSGLRVGAWVSSSDQIAIIRSGNIPIVRGYVGENSINRIQTGDAGRFVPDDALRSTVPIILSRISNDASEIVEIRELASTYGGPIPATMRSEGNLLPAEPLFEVELAPTDLIDVPNQMIRGSAVLQGQRMSLARMLYNRAASVFIKKLNF